MKVALAGSLSERQEDMRRVHQVVHANKRPNGRSAPPCRLEALHGRDFLLLVWARCFHPPAVLPEPSCPASADFRSLQLEGDFGAVGGVQLLHDVADVNFDRAFAQVHFIGDDLVGLSPAQCLGHFDLARRECFVGVG